LVDLFELYNEARTYKLKIIDCIAIEWGFFSCYKVSISLPVGLISFIDVKV